MAKKSNNTGELDGENYAERVDEHGKDLVDLKKKVKSLEDKFGTNEKIADTLCQTDEKATKFSEMLERRLVKMLKSDGNSKKEIKAIVSEQLKQDWKSFALSTGGKIAFALWTILTIWLGHIWK